MSLPRNSSTDADLFQALMNWAIWYTARFTVSQNRFELALKRRAAGLCGPGIPVPADILSRVQDSMREAGLLDDDRFAHGLAASLLRKGTARPAMTARLTARGVPAALARAAVEDVFAQAGHDPDLTAALTAARRKAWGPFARDLDAALALKQKQKMARAGFSGDVVRRVFAMDRAEAVAFLEEND